VNFVDKTFVRLADPAARVSLLDATALEQILGAAYDVDAIGPLQGTFEAIFDEFELGFSAAHIGTFDGYWAQVGSVERTEARFRLAGLADDGGPRVDAIWRGSILAGYAEAGEPITAVHASWPSKQRVDAAVAAANGGVLPGGAAALETARRTELIAELHDDLGDPTRLENEDLDALVASAGATSVGGLLEAGRANPVGVLQVDFGEVQPVSETRRPLPVAAALLVRDTPLAVAELVQESKRILERLGPAGLERPKDDRLRLRNPVVVVWVVPAEVFDDADWPGGTASARRTAAGEWLAREGIGLAAV
jgi:hypothetical protein